MSKQVQDTFAAKFHNIFCWVAIIATRYGTGLRGMVMSYSDPGIIIAFWVIVGGSWLNMYILPVPLFAYIAFTFYKYNQKKLFYYYLITIIIGPILGISYFVKDIQERKQSEIIQKESLVKQTKNEEILSKNYIKYYDVEKKIICTETSRKDLFNFMLQMKPRSAGSISTNRNIAEYAGGNEFVKKYPEFSNLNFNREEDITSQTAAKYKFDLADSYNSWLDMYLTWKDISPSNLNTLLQNICKVTTDEYIQYVKNPNNFKKRKL